MDGQAGRAFCVPHASDHLPGEAAKSLSRVSRCHDEQISLQIERLRRSPLVGPLPSSRHHQSSCSTTGAHLTSSPSTVAKTMSLSG